MDSAEHKVRAPSRHDQFYLLLILLEKEPSFAVLLVDLSFVGWLLAWLRSLQVIGIAAAAAAEPGRPCCVECRTTATPMWRGGPTGPRVSSFLSPYRVICPHRLSLFLLALSGRLGMIGPLDHGTARSELTIAAGMIA